MSLIVPLRGNGKHHRPLLRCSFSPPKVGERPSGSQSRVGSRYADVTCAILADQGHQGPSCREPRARREGRDRVGFMTRQAGRRMQPDISRFGS